MPLASHDARRTGLPRRRRLDARGGSDFWWRGGEATRGRHGQAQWGAGRQRRAEGMEKKNGEKGERGRRLLKVLGCTERRGKKEGVRGLVPCGGANGEERGGPQVERGIAQWPASAPGQLAWEAVM
jgi:hypothetical protein